MSIKHPKVTILLLLVELGHTKHCSMYKYIVRNFLEIKMNGAVNPNTPYSPPVCSIVNEIAKYLKFSCFSPA